MGKNNKLINDIVAIAKRNESMNIEKAAKKDTLQIYSSIVISLYRLLESENHDEKIEMINTVLAESQTVWAEALDNNKDILELCEEETGIDLRYDETK